MVQGRIHFKMESRTGSLHGLLHNSTVVKHVCMCVRTCVAWVHGYASALGPLVGGRYIMLFPANGH